MVRFDQGYLDGLLSLMQRRVLTEREQKALNDILEAEKQMYKHRRRQRRVERRQIREQDGR